MILSQLDLQYFSALHGDCLFWWQLSVELQEKTLDTNGPRRVNVKMQQRSKRLTSIIQSELVKLLDACVCLVLLCRGISYSECNAFRFKVKLKSSLLQLHVVKCECAISIRIDQNLFFCLSVFNDPQGISGASQGSAKITNSWTEHYLFVLRHL